jgi:uncharacterized metal-binding protein
VYGVQCEGNGVQCEVYGVQCEVYGVQCEVYGVQCEVYGVQCEVYGVHDDQHTINYPAPDLEDKTNTAAQLHQDIGHYATLGIITLLSIPSY